MNAFWICMLFNCLLAPAIMIGFGKYFSKGGPENINSLFGYRTSRSMKNKDTWEFAHKYCGKIWLICGSVLLPASIAAMLFFRGKDKDTVADAGVAVLMIQVAVIFCTIAAVELALKKNFDESGRRR